MWVVKPSGCWAKWPRVVWICTTRTDLICGQTKEEEVLGPDQVADFHGALHQQEGTAEDQHEVAHREPVRVRPQIDGEQGRGHVHKIGGEAQKHDAHDERAGQADDARRALILGGGASLRG